MSASQEKRKRSSSLRSAEAEKLAAEQAAEAKKKSLKKVRNIIIAVVVVLVIAAIFIINSNLFYTGMTAVEVNGTKYTAAEVNYLYRTIYSNYVSEIGETAQQYGLETDAYAQMMGLDTSKALDEQLCPFSVEEQTWEDYFRGETLESLRAITMHKDKADAEGFTLTQEEIEDIDSELAFFDYYAAMGGFADTQQYLAAQFGKGVTMDTVRRMAQLTQLSASYAQNKQDSFSNSDEELDAWYAEHRDEYDVISYRQTFVSSSSEAAEPTDEEKAQALEDAKLKADQLLAIATDEAMFESLAAGNEMREADPEPSGRSHALGMNLNSSYKDWLLDPARKPGDMTVLGAGSGCYVLYFVGRNDNSYAMQQVRHILVKAEADESGVYTDEAKATAKAQAEAYLDEWKAGEATEESFAELAKAHSEDTGSAENGGLYDHVMRYSYVQEFEDFAFDESRKSGDTGIVYGESSSYAGYHVMYYVGEGERYDHYIAGSELRSAAAQEWEAAELENYTAVTNYSFRYVK